MSDSTSKRDKVLDAAERFSGPRTCPNCGYQFTFSLFIRRYVMKFGFPKWTCPNCHQLIKYNYTRSHLIGTFILLVCILIMVALQWTLGIYLPDFAFMILFFIIALFALRFASFEAYQ